ncbi:MAG: selenide, water dikinase SelD [Pseudomonadota bacterium]
MNAKAPWVRDVVFVGGGHAHALVLRKWATNPVPGVRLTVIDPAPAAAYSGMLPGLVAGHYALPDLQIDLVRLTRFAGARYIPAAAIGMDAKAQTIEVVGRPDVHFDVASLDIGITARMPSVPGFAEHAIPAKPLGAFAAAWEAFVARVAASDAEPSVALIGGGVAGVELSLTMAHRLRETAGRAELTVLDRGQVLDGVSGSARERLFRAMETMGVRWQSNAAVASVSSDGPVLADGTQIQAALTVGAAGATPAPWLQSTDLPVSDGFLEVDGFLRSTAHAHVFGAGDCVHMAEAPRPKAGVFAVRAAPILDHNIRATLLETPLKPFQPQRSYLKLISLGPKSALAQKGAWVAQGAAMWRWKDHIDRSFMGKLQDLPAMEQKMALPEPLAKSVPSEPLCAGCGGKVGPVALSSALSNAPSGQSEALPSEDAAITRCGDGWQVISTDHLRAVVEDPFTMAQIALNHAMGDVYAMGAKPQMALAQIILPHMSDGLQARTLEEITAGTRTALAHTGAHLAGGHTTMGSELTIGFTVTGLTESEPITLSGAQPGDVLVLTRPVGSGTLFAAEMRGQAKAQWIVDLVAQLLAPQHDFATALAKHATAMTDVTGFGLAGHGLNIAKASGVGLKLNLAAVPFFDGALWAAEQGVRSSIWTANQSAAAPLMSGDPETPTSALIHDPQTCGGLLASIPKEKLAQLQSNLPPSAVHVIGKVLDQPPGLTLD